MCQCVPLPIVAGFSWHLPESVFLRANNAPAESECAIFAEMHQVPGSNTWPSGAGKKSGLGRLTRVRVLLSEPLTQRAEPVVLACKVRATQGLLEDPGHVLCVSAR